MAIRFDGKRALVTGGGRGLGRVIAQSLVKSGAKTFVLTKSASSVEILRQEDPDIEVIQIDITDWENVRRAVKSILPVDLLVNNAGVTYDKPFLESTESAIDDVFGVNFKAMFNISQIIAKDFIERKEKGAIVNMSSGASVWHVRPHSIYGSSKAAVDSLTKYMALELGPKQIRVNAVNPTFIPTDMTETVLNDPIKRTRIIDSIPLRRLGEKQEVADVVLFLLSDRVPFVNGVTILIDGGLTLPSL